MTGDLNQVLSDELNAPRVMVFLTVPWSRYENISREAFVRATHVLADSHPEISVQARVLDEDAESTQQWLRTLAIPSMENGGWGYGSILWLAFGTVLDFEMYPGRAGWEPLLDRTLKLWGAP